MGAATSVEHAPYRNRGRNQLRGFLRAFLSVRLTQFLLLESSRHSQPAALASVRR